MSKISKECTCTCSISSYLNLRLHVSRYQCVPMQSKVHEGRVGIKAFEYSIHPYQMIFLVVSVSLFWHFGCTHSSHICRLRSSEGRTAMHVSWTRHCPALSLRVIFSTQNPGRHSRCHVYHLFHSLEDRGRGTCTFIVHYLERTSPGADCSLGRRDSGFLRHPSRCPSSVHAFVAIKTPSLQRAALFSVAGKGDTL